MVKGIIWVCVLYESFSSISQLSTGKISGHLDLSSSSYGQMNTIHLVIFVQVKLPIPDLVNLFIRFWSLFGHDS